MSLKIDANQSATAFHINDGAVLFPYAVDARQAVSNHPLEWSTSPWSREDTDLARKQMAERHNDEVADAKARGLPEPAPPPPPPPPLSAEDQAALDEHNKAVADAAKRLDEYYARKEKERLEAEQVAADEALVASLPPVRQPAPIRSHNLSPAQIRKRAAMDDGERAAADKAAAAKKAEADKAAAVKAAAEKKAADAQAEATKRERERIAGNPPAPSPISPLYNQDKTPQQIAEEKAEADRLANSGAKPTF